MYAGVDVGGTKTLLAVLDDHGVIKETRKFPTPENYHHFVLELRHAAAHLEHRDFKAAGIGTTGTIDRQHGIIIRTGTLPWQRVPLLADVEKVLHCPAVIENDAKIAALSESMLLKDRYRRVLYITISTGIGVGFVLGGKIDTTLNDAGGSNMLVGHRGKLEIWEHFASGKAIVERYGKRAEEIHDEATWKAIVRDLRPGLLELIAILEPEAVVIGGSVGTYFERYKHLLTTELKPYETPALRMPVFLQASRPEEAVIFGCYDLAKATFTKERRHAAAA